MKKNLNLGSGWPGMGAAILSLMASASVACAQVDVLSDLGAPNSGLTSVSTSEFKSQGFNLGGTVGNTFDISQIILGLTFSGEVTSANVYLETAGVSGLPGSTAAPTDLIGTVNNTLIGTSSGGAAEYSVTLAGGSVTLNAATDYALIIDTFGIGGSSASVNWQYTYTSDSTYFTTVDGSGFSGAWNRANKSPFAWNQTGTGTQARYMDLQVVPEPSTQALMVLGAAGLLISVRRQRKNLLQISDGNGRNHRK
jgi:hypothetical protein